MSTLTVSSSQASRPYTSRRKRHRLSEPKPTLSSRAVAGLLGLFIVILLVSLGVIASQAGSDNAEYSSVASTE
ncbi:hypothetical protein F0P96_08010 [Hymenobacter busanensis]|uniref:Uncharacterized protein n=1 Tax=Hymenobacter busanensis TaxID=2607656 RepID=A0A7L4ZYR6_9BACT|nr:hypothetical protein [Hymenobacter busanensis]KAA9332925.1 hypothetical protein F0P96_08010 [Hymenobacter busanensis]QHJ08401.1 hypothetical protein GUY19_14320 [Hymenobacter busanensis]